MQLGRVKLLSDGWAIFDLIVVSSSIAVLETQARPPTCCARAAVSAGMWTLMVPDLKQPSAELARMVREILPSMPHAARRVITLLNLEETP